MYSRLVQRPTVVGGAEKEDDASCGRGIPWFSLNVSERICGEAIDEDEDDKNNKNNNKPMDSKPNIRDSLFHQLQKAVVSNLPILLLDSRWTSFFSVVDNGGEEGARILRRVSMLVFYSLKGPLSCHWAVDTQ